MHTYIINDIEKTTKLIEKVDGFAEKINITLLSHRLQSLLIWWKNFNSNESYDFGFRRGRNCLGHKSWIRKFILFVAEKNDIFVGIAPLFISEVQIKGEKTKLKVLSFCPDSVMFFYQDFLIHPEYRKTATASLFKKITTFAEHENMLLFLGHIPEDSPNLKYIRNEISKSLNDGWFGGETTNCRKEGIFPWNLKQLSSILESSSQEPICSSSLKINIQDITKKLNTQTTALLLFPKTRKELERKIYLISETFHSYPSLIKYAKKISNLITKKPIEYPYLYLPNSHEAFYTALSSSKKYFYKRYLKKYYQEGGTFENLSPSFIKPYDIDEYLELHAIRWKNESAAITKKTIEFHKELCLKMSQAGYFNLFFALYKSKRIAALSCFDIGKRREFYYSGRIMEFSQLRAGKLIVLHAILDAINKGFDVFDFGYGGEDYKYDFTKYYRTLKSFLLVKNVKMPDLAKLFPLFEDISL